MCHFFQAVAVAGSLVNVRMNGAVKVQQLGPTATPVQPVTLSRRMYCCLVPHTFSESEHVRVMLDFKSIMSCQYQKDSAFR